MGNVGELKLLDSKGILSLVKTWGETDWISKAADHRKAVGRIRLKEDAARTLGKQVRKSIERQQVEDAIRWGMVSLLLSDGAVVEQSKFIDELRPSVHSEDIEARLRCLAKVLGELRDAVLKMQELQGAAERLMDFSNFVALYRATRVDEEALLRRLHAAPELSLHAMLVTAELAFAGLAPRKTVPFAKAIEEMDKEEIASGVSYAIEAYTKSHGLILSQFRLFTANDPAPMVYDADIVLAAQLREIIESEVRVYRLGYRCVHVDGAEWRVLPPSERYGMALSLGYIRHAQAPYAHIAKVPRSALPFVVAAEKFVEKFADQILWMEGEPGQERLVLGLPADVLRILSERLFLPKEFFAEEGADLDYACHELLTSDDKLLGFELAPGLTLFDAFRIQRVFRFIGLVRVRALHFGGVSGLAARNSMLALMEEHRLIAMLETAGFDSGAVKGFLQLYGWDAADKDFLDIQYRPLLRVDGVYVLPLLILGFSNVVRNGLFTAQMRLHPDGRDNPVEKIVAHAMRESGADVSPGRDYEYAGDVGQVDVLAKIGNRVFAFECKETLLPCGAFEQRTTWDYLEKGAEQLNRLLEAWADEDFRRQFGKKLGWDLSSAGLSTCIVLSHRLLSGISFRGHPVRQVKELANIVARGASELTVLDESFVVPMRQEGQLVAGDFDDYLSENGRIYGAYWKAFDVEHVAWDLQAARVVMPRYAFDAIRQFAASGLVEASLAEKLRRAAECLFSAQRTLDDTAATTERYKRFHERVQRLVRSAVRELRQKYPKSAK